MTGRTRLSLGVMLFVIMIAAGMVLSSERNRLVFLDGVGTVDGTNQRALLGARLGMSAEEAQAQLKTHGVELDPLFDRSSKDFACFSMQPAGSQILVFSDRTWRRGVICLSLDDDRVTRIDWYYNPLSP
jgi:hypothetical protein